MVLRFPTLFSLLENIIKIMLFIAACGEFNKLFNRKLKVSSFVQKQQQKNSQEGATRLLSKARKLYFSTLKNLKKSLKKS